MPSPRLLIQVEPTSHRNEVPIRRGSTASRSRRTASTYARTQERDAAGDLVLAQTVQDQRHVGARGGEQGEVVVVVQLAAPRGHDRAGAADVLRVREDEVAAEPLEGVGERAV